MANAGRPVPPSPVISQRYEMGEPIVSMRHNPKSNTFYALGAFSFFWKGRDDAFFSKHPILSPDNTLETCRSFEYVPGQFLCVTIYNYASGSVARMYIKSLRYPGPQRFETRFAGLVNGMPNQEHNICADNLGRVHMLDVPTGNIVRTQDFQSFQVDEPLTRMYRQVASPGCQVLNIKIGQAPDASLEPSAFIGTTAGAVVVHGGRPTRIVHPDFGELGRTVNYGCDPARNRLLAYFDVAREDTDGHARRCAACRVDLDDGAIVPLGGHTPTPYRLSYPGPLAGFRSCPMAVASRDSHGDDTDNAFYVVAQDGDNHKVVLQSRAGACATDIPAMLVINALYQYDGTLYVGTDRQVLAYRESDLFGWRSVG